MEYRITNTGLVFYTGYFLCIFKNVFNYTRKNL